MSATNGYQTVGSIKRNKAKGGGNAAANFKKPVWVEVKTSPEVDLKATNPVIHLRVSKGIPGKKAMKYAKAY